MACWSPFRALYSLILLLILPMYINSFDPDPLLDFCVADLNSSVLVNGFPCKPAAQVTSADFFFSGLATEGNTKNLFGAFVTRANVLTFPALNTLGIAMSRLDIAPGGVNLPHSHPRASETGVVIQGTVLVGFVASNNVFYSKVIGPGDMFVVPRGLVHFQQNIGKDKALVFTAFNSQLPGNVVASINLFGSTPEIPNQVLTKAFQVDSDTINTIKSKFGS